MKARPPIDEAATSFGPKALKIIGHAFDEAWASIAPQFYSSVAITSARLQRLVVADPKKVQEASLASCLREQAAANQKARQTWYEAPDANRWACRTQTDSYRDLTMCLEQPI
jgi:hypothetical protein